MVARGFDVSQHQGNWNAGCGASSNRLAESSHHVANEMSKHADAWVNPIPVHEVMVVVFEHVEAFLVGNWQSKMAVCGPVESTAHVETNFLRVRYVVFLNAHGGVKRLFEHCVLDLMPGHKEN